MRVLHDFFTREQLEEIRRLPQVEEAYQKTQSFNNVYFTIPLTETLKDVLNDRFQLDLSQKTTIPCRWIKGDTIAHIDRGQRSFEHTYLVYLTDGEGQFILGDESYPIQAGEGFSFSEGLSHEVTGTGNTTRLLLGPMSEQGFAVGGSTAIQANGQTETVSFVYESGSGIYYRINGGSLQNVSLPITIQNTNTSYTLKVLFETDIIVESNSLYFICGSDNIQFGSTSLKSDGTRPTFIINVNSYDGVFYNGEETASGYNNISIYNLVADGTGYSLQIGAGWLCQKGFGNGTSGNYIVNCSSTGDLPGGAVGSGGIVGAFAGKEGSLTLIGCSSSGNMGQLDGGIVGAFAGKSGGSVTCEQCYAIGTIGNFAGGIFGDYAGDSGSASATKCYTTGSVGGNAGGIFGRYGGNNGSASASSCYSLGSVAADGGGIYGLGAATGTGIATASNCYSSGTITTTGNGIYGTGKRVAGSIQTNCYSANGSWSDSTANSNLTGDPVSSDVGTTWIKTGTNQPYELNGIGYTPYSTTVIDSSSQLVQSFSQTVNSGESTIEALIADASGNEFTILEKAGGDTGSYPTITMSVQTGAISTTAATVPGTYTITLRSTGSYHITTFVLTVSGDAVDSISCCVTTMDQRGLDYQQITDYKIGNRLLLEVSQNSKTTFDGYSQYVKYKQAQGSRKI